MDRLSEVMKELPLDNIRSLGAAGAASATGSAPEAPTVE